MRRPGASRHAATVFKSYRPSPRDTPHGRGLGGGSGAKRCLRAEPLCNSRLFSGGGLGGWWVNLQSVAGVSLSTCKRGHGKLSRVVPPEAWQLRPCFSFLNFISFFLYFFLIWEKASATSVKMDGINGGGEEPLQCKRVQPIEVGRDARIPPGRLTFHFIWKWIRNRGEGSLTNINHSTTAAEARMMHIPW